MAVTDSVLAPVPTGSTRTHFNASDPDLAALVEANWSPVLRKSVAVAEVFAAKASGPFSIGDPNGSTGVQYGEAGDVIVYDPATGVFEKVSAADLESLYDTQDAAVVTMTGAALAYTRNAAAAAIDTGLTVTDADSTNLESATVTISANYDQGDDVLAVSTALGISGTFDAATGVLTMTGVAPVADWQTRLRAVTFFSATGASTAQRTVSVQVRDTGNKPSNTATRNITVS